MVLLWTAWYLLALDALRELVQGWKTDLPICG